jgi:hypothetical protein
MELVERRRQQQLVRFPVQQELHLNHLELKALRLVEQQAELAVQQVQPVQEQAEQQEA